MDMSDEGSSDSSNEFLVPADQLDLNSSFFTQSSKSPRTERTPVAEESSEEGSEECDYANEESAEFLSQVLRNLEKAKSGLDNSATGESEASTSKSLDRDPKDCPGDLSSEITDLLLKGEGPLARLKEEDDDDVEDSEVDEGYTIPQKGVQIHLPGESRLFDKKRKKQEDLQKLLQSKFNQRIRSAQVLIHKAGLLCWLSHGFFLNGLANDPDLLKATLAAVSTRNYPKDRPDLSYIEKFTKWFAGLFQICEKHQEIVCTKNLLLERMSDKKIYNYVELILLYVATVRGMGINCRLVVSLNPPPLKPSPEQLFKLKADRDNEPQLNLVKKEEATEEVDKKVDTKKTSKSTLNGKGKSAKSTRSGKEQVSLKETTSSKTKALQNSREADKITSLESKKRAAATLKREISEKPKLKQKKHLISTQAEKDDKESNDIKDESNLTIASKLRLRSGKSKREESKGDTLVVKRQTRSRSRELELLDKEKKGSSSKEKHSDGSELSTDEDYVESKPKKRAPREKIEGKSLSAKLADMARGRKLFSSDEEEKSPAKDIQNVWAEVYNESEETWISINLLEKKIHCISEIYRRAASPVLYVVAWNAAGKLKDVTRRYCPHWLTDTRKKRVDEKWWSETLSNWREKRSAMSKLEDEELLQRELEQPLPKTITECKGHPLYVLARHLLKFEALYPPDAVPLGHLKTGDAIYSRYCVHTLYSRETWVRKARVVKPAQTAYKIVKSMPKYDKLSGTVIKDLPLELFGRWQTTPYVPAEAKDGKVPRNEYGNVDLFKMSMLPKGTVHINLPGLNRIARKLNIDCAPACVGFNFGCRGALPAFEGFVVCEEYEDTVCEAWEEEQVAARKRAREKREKRIYGNWRKLLRGLIIRERLASKYNFGAEDEEPSGGAEARARDHGKSLPGKAKRALKPSKRGEPAPDKKNPKKLKLTK